MEINKAVAIVQVFSGTSASTLNTLAKHSSIKQMKKGEILFIDKEKVNTIYAVVAGAVSLYKINGLGEKKIIFILDRGKLINEVILQELPASINCEIFEDSLILCINKNDLLKTMEQDFVLTKAIIDSLAMKVRRLYRQLKNTANTIRGDKRVAAKLWKLSEDFGKPCKNGTCIDIDVTITYLAEMLGSTRETVSRQIKILQGQSLILQEEGKFIIPDKDNLVKYFKAP